MNGRTDERPRLHGPVGPRDDGGDIFFPKRWTDASLGGHRSPEAARIVRAFLDDLPPGYPDRLRRIILSSADDLFRASRMR